MCRVKGLCVSAHQCMCRVKGLCVSAHWCMCRVKGLCVSAHWCMCSYDACNCRVTFVFVLNYNCSLIAKCLYAYPHFVNLLVRKSMIFHMSEIFKKNTVSERIAVCFCHFYVLANAEVCVCMCCLCKCNAVCLMYACIEVVCVSI